MALGVALVLQAPVAAGQPAGPPAGGESAAEARKSEAKRRFLRGLELVQNEAWDAALAEFLASRELHPTRVALKNAAICLRQLNRFAEALGMYEELLRLFGASLPAEEKRAANEAMAALQKNVADLIIESDPAGATVIVDGKERGLTPLPRPVTVDAGTHVVRPFKEGYLPFEAQIVLPGTHRRVVRAQLRALAQSGRLQVQEAEGRALDVIVDGAVMGKTPWSGTLAVGQHTVALRGADDLGAPPTAATVDANRLTTLTLRATRLDAEIRIEPTPANARVDIDGVQIGSGVWEGRLQSGSHRIEVTAEAFLAYRREVAVRAGQREVLRVALERDLTNPRWREDVFRPHIFVEVVAAGAVAPGFGGSADAACGRGECSKRSRPAGALVGARGGYQLTSGRGSSCSSATCGWARR